MDLKQNVCKDPSIMLKDTEIKRDDKLQLRTASTSIYLNYLCFRPFKVRSKDNIQFEYYGS